MVTVGLVLIIVYYVLLVQIVLFARMIHSHLMEHVRTVVRLVPLLIATLAKLVFLHVNNVLILQNVSAVLMDISILQPSNATKHVGKVTLETVVVTHVMNVYRNVVFVLIRIHAKLVKMVIF
jgi:hypothetical protein